MTFKQHVFENTTCHDAQWLFMCASFICMFLRSQPAMTCNGFSCAQVPLACFKEHNPPWRAMAFNVSGKACIWVNESILSRLLTQSIKLKEIAKPDEFPQIIPLTHLQWCFRVFATRFILLTQKLQILDCIQLQKFFVIELHSIDSSDIEKRF